MSHRHAPAGRSEPDTGSGFETEDVPLGFADELATVLAPLPAGAAIDPDEALDAALATYQEAVAEVASAVTPSEPAAPGHRGTEVLIGGRPTTLDLGDEIVIGRTGDHVVDHPTVSRRHLRLRVTPAGLCCHDMGAANGSWLIRHGERTAIDSTDVALVASDRIVTSDDIELLRVPEEP